MNKQFSTRFGRVQARRYIIWKNVTLILGLAVIIILIVANLKRAQADTNQDSDDSFVYLSFISKSESLPTTAVPYGPFHFGEELADYAHPKASAFNSGFVDLGLKSDLAINLLLSEAQTHGYQVVVNISPSYPCTYWDGQTFDGVKFVDDVLDRADNIAPFYPDTVIGIMLLNEPHDPQPECQPAIPPLNLYIAAQQIRAGLVTYGMEDVFLGFGSPPNYIEEGLSDTQSRDGTINLSFVQWSDSIDFDVWVALIQGAASKMSEGGYSHRLIYSANGDLLSSQELIDYNLWACVQADALLVTWWHWNLANGPKDQISLSQFQSVRDTCDNPGGS